MPQSTTPHSNRDISDIAYLRCLRGQISAPNSGRERIFFQAIMVLFMSSCMVTINELLRQSGAPSSGIAGTLYEYPLMFCIAFIVRVFVANPLVDCIVPHIPSSLSGIKRTLAMTGINVGIMATIMTFFGTLVARGPEGFTWMEFVSNAPISVAMAFTVNFFAISPMVKIAYTRALKPRLIALAVRLKKMRKTLLNAFSSKPSKLKGKGSRRQSENQEI